MKTSRRDALGCAQMEAEEGCRWMEGVGGKCLEEAEAAGWRDGNAVRCRVSVQRFAVFAVHRGGQFLAVRFRFAFRFAAFLQD